MTLVMQWMLRMHADATAHDYGLQDGLRAGSDDKRLVGYRNYPRIALALFGGLTLSSLGMDVADAWLSSFFAQQGFALPVDFAMGLSAFAFAAGALLPLRAWLASRMGLHAYLLVYFCSKVSALMLMRLVPAGASLSTAAIFGVALASILILLLVAVHLKRGHADGSVEYGGVKSCERIPRLSLLMESMRCLPESVRCLISRCKVLPKRRSVLSWVFRSLLRGPIARVHIGSSVSPQRRS